ncbi:MAG: ectoine synthase [Methanomicrobia archaeon]|nr:ectoine synthase [Methanomicrobia archaeon]
MILRTFQDAERSERRVATANWESVRLLLRDDNMGFSFHITTIYAGTETPIWYQNHLESVYCIEGEGEVETVADKRIYPIKPGTMYVLDQHDRHLLRAKTPLKLACVFNPPLHGNEVHDENGVYPLVAEQIGD